MGNDWNPDTDSRMSDGLLAQLSAMIRNAGVSQGEIARRSNLSPGAISKYLSGDSMPSVASIERIVEACGGVVRLLKARELSDSLPTLTPQQRMVMEAMERMPPDDAARIAGLTRALATTEGLARDLLVGQLDAIVSATRKSSGSEAAETRKAV